MLITTPEITIDDRTYLADIDIPDDGEAGGAPVRVFRRDRSWREVAHGVWTVGAGNRGSIFVVNAATDLIPVIDILDVAIRQALDALETRPIGGR